MLRNAGCFVLGCFMLGCTYEPGEEAFHKIDKPDPRTFEVDFFSETDTLYIGDAMFLNFYPPDDKDLVASQILIDDQVILEGEGVVSSYHAIPESLPAGYGMLTVRYYQKTGSGSLADIIDAEFYEFEFSRPVLIDNAPMTILQIQKTEVIDSTLVIYWNKFTGYNFQSYEINHNYGTTIITDQEIDHLAIEGYPAGELSVGLTLNAKNRSVSHHEFYGQGVGFTAQPVGVDSLRVSWNGSPYRAFKGVQLSFNGSDLPAETVDLRTGTRATDTTIYFPVGFPFNYYMDALAIDNQPYYGQNLNINESLIQSPYASGTTPSLLRFQQNNKRLMLYYNSGSGNERDRVRLYTGDTEARTIAGPAMSMSYSGEHLVRASMIAVDKLVLDRINPATLDVTESRTITVPAGTFAGAVSVHISNDEYILAVYGTGNALLYVVYHWPTQAIVYSGTANVNNQPGKTGWLMDGGRYYAAGDVYGDLSVSPLDTRSASIPGAIPIPYRNQLVYYSTVGSEFRVRVFLGGSTPVLTIPINDTVINYAVNENSQLGVLVQKADGKHYFEVYNLETGAFVERMRLASGIVAPGNYGYRFSGNQFWLQAGLIPNKWVHQFNYSL